MQVEGQREGSLLSLSATGARVSNAYPTFPLVGHSPAKVGLTPYVIRRGNLNWIKGLSLRDGHASDQVVGGVTAHLADDQ